MAKRLKYNDQTSNTNQKTQSNRIGTARRDHMAALNELATHKQLQKLNELSESVDLPPTWGRLCAKASGNGKLTKRTAGQMISGMIGIERKCRATRHQEEAMA